MSLSNAFYTIKKETHSEYCAFELQINWNVTNISKSTNADGYIVQYFSRTSHPPVDFLEDISYFEAWRVTNGSCQYDSNTICDDLFAVGSWFSHSSEINNSIGKAGEFRIEASVYWIPKASTLFEFVDKWTTTEVPQANGLKSCYSFPELSNEYHVFSRPLFIHKWDFRDPLKVKSVIKECMFTMCHENTPRDESILKANLSCIFAGHPTCYEILGQEILNDWYAQWD